METSTSTVYFAGGQPRTLPSQIQAAMVEQAKKLTITSRVFRNDQLGLFYEDLARPACAQVLPMNNGAEAVEDGHQDRAQMGLRVRGVPEDKAEIVVCANNFSRPHHRRYRLLDRSAEAQGLWPVRARLPHRSVRRFRCARRSDHAEHRCILVEPIQGEGGVIIPPAGAFRQVRDLCTGAEFAHPRPEMRAGSAARASS